MKRLLVCLLTILMIFSSFCVCVFADTQPKISVGNVKVQPGKTVLLPISLENNKGIWGIEFNVNFDTSVFEVQEVVHNGEVFEKGDFMIGPADFSEGYVRFVISAMNHLYDNNTNNGTVCYIKLKTSKDAKVKEYPFEVDSILACNVDAQDVTVTGESGSVKVVSHSVNNIQNIKDEEVVVEAEDNKVIDNYEVGETTVVVENVTDKKGEAVTDKNGQKQTVTKVLEIKETQKENFVDVSPEEKEVYGDPFTAMDAIKYIVLALAVVGVTVLVIVVIKKKK